MSHFQAVSFKLLFAWLFIAIIGLTVSSKKLQGAVYEVNWRTTSAVSAPSGQAKFILYQESHCITKEKDENFYAVFTKLDSKWTMLMTHAKDIPFTNHEGRCHARSKATLALSQGNVLIHIRLNGLCSDEACEITNLSGKFTCGVIKAPKGTNQFFSVAGAPEQKCI